MDLLLKHTEHTSQNREEMRVERESNSTNDMRAEPESLFHNFVYHITAY